MAGPYNINKRRNMVNTLPIFRITVRPSPETNDHEVFLFADDTNLIELFAPDLMGLDPDDLLIEPCALRAATSPHAAVIGRCRCGDIGCGSVAVNIHAEGTRVSWTAGDSARRIQFEATQYALEVERSLQDHSWETPDRTAARLISQAVDRTSLARRGFEFFWASGRSPKGMMTASLLLRPGPYQVLVRLPWDGKDVGDIVRQFETILRRSPEDWPGVECNPQAQDLGPPPFTGPGWN
jgi:hypothetical protein